MMKGGGPIYDKFSQNFSYSLKYYYNLSVLVCFLKQVKRQAVNLWRPLETFERARGRPLLIYKDVCKRAMKALNIDVASWETTAADRDAWKLTLKRQLPEEESRWKTTLTEKRARRKAS